MHSSCMEHTQQQHCRYTGDNEYTLCVYYVSHILRIPHSQDVHGNQPMGLKKIFFEIIEFDHDKKQMSKYISDLANK